MRRLALLPLLAALLLSAGCVGGAPAEYGGINEYEARERAAGAVSRELRDPASPLYGHKVQMDRATMGHSSGNETAWVVHFTAPTFGGEFCVRIWAKTALTVRTYYTEVDYCEGEPAQPSAGGPPA